MCCGSPCPPPHDHLISSFLFACFPMASCSYCIRIYSSNRAIYKSGYLCFWSRRYIICAAGESIDPPPSSSSYMYVVMFLYILLSLYIFPTSQVQYIYIAIEHYTVYKNPTWNCSSSSPCRSKVSFYLEIASAWIRCDDDDDGGAFRRPPHPQSYFTGALNCTLYNSLEPIPRYTQHNTTHVGYALYIG